MGERFFRLNKGEEKMNITKIAEDVHKVFLNWNKKNGLMLFALKRSYNYKHNGIEVRLNPRHINLSTRKHNTEVMLFGKFLFCIVIPLSASKEEIANLFREEFNKCLLNLYNEVEILEKVLGVENK